MPEKRWAWRIGSSAGWDLKNLCILGSTGSIGVSTLKVVAQFPGKFRVRSLTAGRNVRQFAQQVRAFRPERVAIADEKLVPELRALLEDGAAALPRPYLPQGREDSGLGTARFSAERPRWLNWRRSRKATTWSRRSSARRACCPRWRR